MYLRLDNRGFTLTELMVSLVVSSLLMVSLVAVSSSVQRSFGGSREKSELQSNLRFAMKNLVEDFNRTAYMLSPDVANDPCHVPPGTTPPAEIEEAFSFDPATMTYTLRGNFLSSRDYLYDLDTQTIVCRNKMPNLGGTCGVPGGSSSQETLDYLAPFGDGPPMAQVLAAQRWVRVEVEGSRYAYHRVGVVTPASSGLTLVPAVDRDVVKGQFRWISPISEIQYVNQLDPDINTVYAKKPWELERQWVFDNPPAPSTTINVQVAAFLLPPAQGGFQVEVINDVAPGAGLCLPAWLPNIEATSTVVQVAGDINPVTARALVLTLRGRTEGEDREFFIPGYTADPPPTTEILNFGCDLDGDFENGLAHVRTERTVVQLRNLSLNVSM